MENLVVKISNGNTKTGKIKSVSLPPVVTCRQDAPCIKKCYARRLLRYPNVRNAYESNLQLYKENPALYFDGITACAINEEFFRWHVSGDIPDIDYFRYMCGVARTCENTLFLCFTKKYEIVNNFIFEGGIVPPNLIIIFSMWDTLYCKNPYDFATAEVITAEEAKHRYNVCTGNCLDCAKNNRLCWAFQNGLGGTVYLVEH